VFPLHLGWVLVVAQVLEAGVADLAGGGPFLELDLVHQVDIGEYRDALRHDLKDSMAFLKAQADVDEFGVAREQLCKTLDDCDVGGDLVDAARRIFEMRRAKPGIRPRRTGWQTGP
jgi:hypothetical protein